MIENSINKALFSQNSEKTFIDKILARQDVERVRDLIKKDELNRQDLMEILNMLSSVETKLLNYGEWDRYIMAKYFVWIRDFVKTAEQLYDYEADLEKEKYDLDKETKQLFNNAKRNISHNIKFLVDLYFNLARTTLSLGGTGILELLKNKYEIFYPSGNPSQNTAATSNPNTNLYGTARGK